MPPKQARQLSQDPDQARSHKKNKFPPDDDNPPGAAVDFQQEIHNEAEEPDNDDTKSNASGHSAASLLTHETEVIVKEDGPDDKKDKGKEKDSGNSVSNDSGNQDWGYDDATNKRIAKIRAFHNTKTCTLYIGKATGQLQWTKIEQLDKDNYYALAVPGVRGPVKLWFIGTMVKNYFYDINGDAPSSVSIHLNMLDSRETTLANNLLVKHSVPATGNGNTYSDVRFSRWMAMRHPGEDRMRAEHFNELYDARNGFVLPRDKMPCIAPKILKKGDLVFIEATVARWHPRKEGKTKKSHYAEYNAFYSISYMALLDSSPPPGLVNVTVDDEENEVDF